MRKKIQRPGDGFIGAMWLPEGSHALKVVAFNCHFNLSKSFGATCNTSLKRKW